MITVQRDNDYQRMIIVYNSLQIKLIQVNLTGVLDVEEVLALLSLLFKTKLKSEKLD